MSNNISKNYLTNRSSTTTENEIPRCRCGDQAKLRLVTKNNDNYGRVFWGCPRFGNSAEPDHVGCGYFKWVDRGSNDPSDNNRINSTRDTSNNNGESSGSSSSQRLASRTTPIPDQVKQSTSPIASASGIASPSQTASISLMQQLVPTINNSNINDIANNTNEKPPTYFENDENDEQARFWSGQESDPTEKLPLSKKKDNHFDYTGSERQTSIFNSEIPSSRITPVKRRRQDPPCTPHTSSPVSTSSLTGSPNNITTSCLNINFATPDLLRIVADHMQRQDRVSAAHERSKDCARAELNRLNKEMEIFKTEMGLIQREIELVRGENRLLQGELDEAKEKIIDLRKNSRR
ncbi:hypothetical protein G9A89_016124 [Geosiphon pyriformis]|nr:hypothetical protein G9A89_016124 [Geosiphon pyriformis]